VGVKVGLLLLEAQGKEQWLPPGDYSPEETSGVFNMAFFGWLNNLLIVGYRKILSVEDLYALDPNLASGPIQSRFWRHGEDRESQTKSHKLLRTTLRTFTLPYLYPILPRVALIAFSFCRPFLINGILTYLENPDSTSANASYGFIGAALFVYVGIAVSTGAYWYLHHRSLLMTRACLVSAIYQRTTQLSLSALNNSAAVTLMSTDIERIQNGMRDAHECWADLIEVALATWLLERQLGAACIAPIAVVLVCAVTSIGMGKFTGKRQGTWMNNIQKRVGVTANAISNMTSLKMSGLTGQVTSLIQDLRTGEIRSAMRFRMFNVAASIMAFIPLLMLPVVTFAVINRDLTVTRVFTSLSYLMLLSNPLTQLFQTFPQILAAIACFKRVERFLLSTSQRDTCTYLFSTAGGSDIRRGRLLTLDAEMSSVPACVIKNGNFGWVPGEYTLQNINMHIPKGQLSMIVGPVASGKSTLCKAFLGEIPFALGSTVFRTKFDQISFCDQSAFLVNTTIRKNILGQGVFNGPWYDEIIDATALMYDFDKLIDGDDTLVGTNGINLSGGQRHRIALARALYARPDLAIFDDIFSGLDLKTEEHVFRKVFGPQGILKRRKTTVVLCTQSIQHLPGKSGSRSNIPFFSFWELGILDPWFIKFVRSWYSRDNSIDPFKV
jgi:ATP-binding cassette subfamily C (CFTR/MRP) protein 1